MAASGWKAHQKLDCVGLFFSIFLPLSLNQRGKKNKALKREVTATLSLCVLTLFHGFPCLPPIQQIQFFSFFFISLFFIWFTESQIHLQGLSTVGQSSGDWLGGGGVWQLCPVDIPLFPLVVKTNQFLEKRGFLFSFLSIIIYKRNI